MADLASQKCVPCEGGVPPLSDEKVRELLGRLDGWGVEKNHHLLRTFTFPDFKKALSFVNKVGEVAEAEGHHPDIYLSWGMVRVETWTHAINGLTENDFILAAKIDKLPRG
ncbi:MAG TPA: 4a-hydroxytetrahydrobiopterin dehydratase [Phycisphaerae bacterium]|nr:4a-hydroxytetrahydrobiopterin dehydratase [Phycisphaerae bacterium]